MKTFDERTFREQSTLIAWVNERKDTIEVVSVQHELRQNQYENWNTYTVYFWRIEV